MIWKPSIELREKDNQFTVTVEMPGVDPGKMDIEVTPEELLVTAETREERKEEKDEKGKVYSSELKTGQLFRSIAFPRKVHVDKVKAELKNGVLTVTAPAAEEQEAKRVEVSAA